MFLVTIKCIESDSCFWFKVKIIIHRNRRQVQSMKRSELETRRHHSRYTVCTVSAVPMSSEVQQTRSLWRLPSVLHSVALCRNCHEWRIIKALSSPEAKTALTRWRGGQFVTYRRYCTGIYRHDKRVTIGVPTCMKRAKHNCTTCSFAQSRKCGGEFHARTSIRHDLCCSEIYQTRSFS